MRRMRLNRAGTALVLTLSAALGGCAAASKAPFAPEASAPAEARAPQGDDAPAAEPSLGFHPTTPVEEADPAAELARAERDLEASLGGDRTFARPPEKKLEVAPRKEAPEGEGAVCGTACRALASMQRSAERLCALSAAEDAPSRCEDARSRVRRAEGLVAERCARCDGP